jgi:phosphoglucosamine mutase
MFGTAGIRGIYGKDITEELAFSVANAFAGGAIAISRDTRATGTSLMNAAISGALAKGANVIDLGILATPTLAFATIKHKCNGLQITASHNPPEYNGFKLFTKGRELTKEEEKKFEGEYKKGTVLAKYDALGAIRQDGDIIEGHKNMIKKLVDRDAISRKKLNVLIDCNGAAATITPSLVRDLGCNATEINSGLRGFSRPSEPNAENLRDTIAMAKNSKSDIAIAHDGDGDRCVVIDDRGEILPLDVQLAMMIEHELGKSKNKKAVITVEASLLVREAIENAGGEAIITSVGSVYVSEMLEKKNAFFGGEPCGEYVYSEATHGADGVLAAAKFLEIIATKGKLSELRKKYRGYPMIREKFQCARKYEAIGKIKSGIKIEGKRSESDGLRIDEEDGWFLIRASGTESIVRLTMEYKDKKKLEQRADYLRKLIKNVV